MEPNKYIETGILELYVLGLTTPEQSREVEKVASTSPEIRAEIASLETALEIYARSKGINPPPGLRASVMNSLQLSSGSTTTRSSGNRGLMNGLLIGLLALSVILAAYYYMSQKDYAEQLQNISGQHNQLQADYNTLKDDCDARQVQLAVLRDADNKKVLMEGTEKAPTAVASVYWNASTKKTYLDVIELPTPPSGKQYQLWAIVDGNPVDMGVFDIDLTSTTLQEVPFIENPQAFAVTLEDAGGKPTPNLDELYVIGNVS